MRVPGARTVIASPVLLLLLVVTVPRASASFFGLSQGSAPALSTASVTNDAIAQSVSIALTLDFDRTLSSGTVTTSTVTLQAHGTNLQSGTPSGANACSSVTLGADGSGNSDRRITCAHSALASGAWYTLTATTGIQSAGAVALASAVTRRFKIAYATGDRQTVTAANLESMVAEGWFTRSGAATTTTKLTAVPQLETTVSVGSGTATVTVPQSAEITKSDGGTFDSSAFVLSDATSVVTGAPATVRGAVQYGVPNVALAVSASVTMSIPVASTLNGATLQVYRSPDTDFTDNATQFTTCTVSAGACLFTTTSLSYFTVAGSAGAPKSDGTPPGRPTDVVARAEPGAAVLGWDDPTSADLRSIRILLVRSENRTELRGIAPRGQETYTDPTSDLTVGRAYVYVLQSEDTSGNRSALVRLNAVRPLAGRALEEPEPIDESESAPAVTPTPAAPATPAPPAASGGETTARNAPSAAIPIPSPLALWGAPPPVIVPAPDTHRPAESSVADVPASPSGGASASSGSVPSAYPDLSREPVPNDLPTSVTDVLYRGIGDPPCAVTPHERTMLTHAFHLSQGRLPSSRRDLDFLCALAIDPAYPRDAFLDFPTYRNLRAELVALRTFVNFYQRIPSRGPDGVTALPREDASRDWWVVKYLAYHLRLRATAVNAVSERSCSRLFTERTFAVYKNGVRIVKPAGQFPGDTIDFDFVRACAYASAPSPKALGGSAR